MIIESSMVEIDPPAYFMTMLNETGDTSITWSEPDDVEVLTYIQKKMDEGYVFFIERPVLIRAFIKKRKIDNVAAIKTRNIIVSDQEATQLELAGKIQKTRLEYGGSAAHEPVRRAKTAKEVASSRTYALRPVRGG